MQAMFFNGNYGFENGNYGFVNVYYDLIKATIALSILFSIWNY